MGLTSRAGDTPCRADAEIAKDYLNENEIVALNRIVTAYLEFAELQALHRKPMHMHDWVTQFEAFLRLSGREILTHASTISHDEAPERARAEYDKHHAAHLDDPSPVEKHFLEMQQETQMIGQSRPEHGEQPSSDSGKMAGRVQYKQGGKKHTPRERHDDGGSGTHE